MLLVISTEPKAFPHVAPRPPIHSYTTSYATSLKQCLMTVFIVSSAIAVAISVMNGKHQWDLDRREHDLLQYTPAENRLSRFNSTASSAEHSGYQQDLMDSDREGSLYDANLQRYDDHAEESAERTVVFNTTYNIDQSYLKPKHETVIIGEIPSRDIHNCIDGVCGPRSSKIKKAVNLEELPGNPNGAGEHIMPSIKPDAEKLPSEIAGEYLKKVKDYVKELKTATPRESYQLRRKYAQSRRQLWNEFNRARNEANEPTVVETERI